MDRMHKNAETAARPRGIAGEFHTLKTGSAATADELREFVRQIKGKSPQEMLGVVAQSGLFIGILQATVITVLAIAIFTIGPFLWNQSHTPDAVAQQSPESATKENTSVEAPKTPAAPAAVPAVTPANDKLTPPIAAKNDKGKILEKLGMDEAKKADPNANPLENKADDLLKDLK